MVPEDVDVSVLGSFVLVSVAVKVVELVSGIVSVLVPEAVLSLLCCTVNDSAEIVCDIDREDVCWPRDMEAVCLLDKVCDSLFDHDFDRSLVKVDVAEIDME